MWKLREFPIFAFQAGVKHSITYPHFKLVRSSDDNAPPIISSEGIATFNDIDRKKNKFLLNQKYVNKILKIFIIIIHRFQ